MLVDEHPEVALESFQIMIGPPPAWYASALPTFLTAAAALGAVWLTNMNARRLHKDEVAERREAHDRDRGLAALQLADHLEDFTVHCISVVISQRQVDWETPYEYQTDYGGVEPIWLEELPPWPPTVDWRLIGFDLAVRASNFRRRALFQKEIVGDYAEHADLEDTHAYSADMAAELGLEAWAIASKVREIAGLAAFEWPDGASDIDSLAAYQMRRADIEQRSAAAIAAEPDPAF
jgi:hypothetical protein